MVDSVGFSKRTVMNRFQQIGLSCSVLTEKQIDTAMRIQRQLIIISEMKQFDLLYFHTVHHNSNGKAERFPVFLPEFQ